MNREEAEQFADNVIASKPDGTFTSTKLKSASVSAVVHRHATGKDEDIGLVSYYHRNPFIHYPMNLIIWLRGLKRKYGNNFSE